MATIILAIGRVRLPGCSCGTGHGQVATMAMKRHEPSRRDISRSRTVEQNVNGLECTIRLKSLTVERFWRPRRLWPLYLHFSFYQSSEEVEAVAIALKCDSVSCRTILPAQFFRHEKTPVSRDAFDPRLKSPFRLQGHDLVTAQTLAS